MILVPALKAQLKTIKTEPATNVKLTIANFVKPIACARIVLKLSTLTITPVFALKIPHFSRGFAMTVILIIVNNARKMMYVLNAWIHLLLITAPVLALKLLSRVERPVFVLMATMITITEPAKNALSSTVVFVRAKLCANNVPLPLKLAMVGTAFVLLAIFNAMKPASVMKASQNSTTHVIRVMWIGANNALILTSATNVRIPSNLLIMELVSVWMIPSRL